MIVMRMTAEVMKEELMNDVVVVVVVVMMMMMLIAGAVRVTELQLPPRRLSST